MARRKKIEALGYGVTEDIAERPSRRDRRDFRDMSVGLLVPRLRAQPSLRAFYRGSHVAAPMLDFGLRRVCRLHGLSLQLRNGSSLSIASPSRGVLAAKQRRRNPSPPAPKAAPGRQADAAPRPPA